MAYNTREIKGIAPTLTTQCATSAGSSAVLKLENNNSEPYLKIRSATKKGYEEAKDGDYVNITYPSSNTKRGRVGKEISHTLTTGDGNGVVTENVRIRKLTPKECLRLMGWRDTEIDRIQSAGISATQQYRQAGNGIVVPVLMAIFGEMFNVPYKELIDNWDIAKMNKYYNCN